MKNKLIAILVLIIAAGVGYYFLFTGKKDAALTTEGLAALTPAQISALSDAQIGAITMAQKATLTGLQINAINAREAAIKAAKTAKDAADKKAAEQAVIDAKKALETSIAANNTALATQQAETLRLAQLEAARIATEQAARIAAEQQIINDLKAKAAAVTVAKIKTYTQAQIDEALALDESQYFTPAQIKAFDDRKIAIIEENRIAALRANLSLWTKADIDKLTSEQLRKLDNETLTILAELAPTASSEYKKDIEVLKRQDQFIIDYNSLSEWDKQDARNYAEAIKDDMSKFFGGNHHVRYYSYVSNFSDAKLWYFIKHAWEMVDSQMFYTRLGQQDFTLLDASSRNGDKNSDYYAWTNSTTEIQITALKRKIEEVNLLNDATQIN